MHACFGSWLLTMRDWGVWVWVSIWYCTPYSVRDLVRDSLHQFSVRDSVSWSSNSSSLRPGQTVLISSVPRPRWPCVLFVVHCMQSGRRCYCHEALVHIGDDLNTVIWTSIVVYSFCLLCIIMFYLIVCSIDDLSFLVSLWSSSVVIIWCLSRVLMSPFQHCMHRNAAQVRPLVGEQCLVSLFTICAQLCSIIVNCVS